MSNIEKDFEAEIFSDSVDLATNYAELTIDAFLSDGVLKEIPVVSTLYSIYKIGNSIGSARFVRNMLLFLQQTRNMLVQDETLMKYKESFEKRKDKSEFIAKTLFCLEKIEESWKNELLASAFVSLCSREMSYDEYSFIVDYISVCRKFELTILNTLRNIHTEDGKIVEQLIPPRIGKSMASAGILNLLNNGLVEEIGTVFFGKAENTDRKFKATKFGNQVFEYLKLSKFA